MKQNNLKAKFLGLMVVTIAASSSGLTACSTNMPTQAQTSQTSQTSSSATVQSGNDRQPTVHKKTDGTKPDDMGVMGHSGMDLGPADSEFDLRFIDSMIPHHEGAVVMAREVLQKSKRPELRTLAEAIIQAQEKEIKQMKQWRAGWYPKASSQPVMWHASMGHSMAMTEEQIQAMRMDMDLGQADSQFDLRFINAMIPHHEGAVVMANDALEKSNRPEILQLAKNIVASQQAEIDQMKQWRKSWYGQ